MKPLIIVSILAALLSHLLAAEIPLEVKRLQELRQQKIAEIDKIYHKELEGLKGKYLKSADLEAANEVAAELARIGDGNDASGIHLGRNFPKSDNDLVVYLRDTVWKFDDGKTITFQRDKTIKKSWGVLEPEWKVKDMKVWFEDKVFVFDDTFMAIELTTKVNDLRGVGKLVKNRPAENQNEFKSANRVPGSD